MSDVAIAIWVFSISHSAICIYGFWISRTNKDSLFQKQEHGRRLGEIDTWRTVMKAYREGTLNKVLKEFKRRD